MRALPGLLLWTPEVTISHFSLGEPAQSTRVTGIRFSRKSPAVGLMKRHWPLGARISTLLNGRTAVLSKAWAWATAVGFRVPPAPETGTGVVGLKVRTEPAAASVVAAAAASLEVN